VTGYLIPFNGEWVQRAQTVGGRDQGHRCPVGRTVVCSLEELEVGFDDGCRIATPHRAYPANTASLDFALHLASRR
jgi:hypothetical protein